MHTRVQARVNVTIVAVNQPPVLKGPVEFSATEDQMVDIDGISATDPDVAEVVTSQLAHLVRRKRPPSPPPFPPSLLLL